MSDKERELKVKWCRLSRRIKKHIAKHNVTGSLAGHPLIKEFQEINNELINAGFDCPDSELYNTIDYWLGPTPVPKSTTQKPVTYKTPKHQNTQTLDPNIFKGLEESIMDALGKCTEQYNTIISRMETPPSPNKYHINLVWEDEAGESKNIILEEVGKYLKEMGCSELGYDFNDGFLGKEHIYKYEFYGDETKYQTIIQSANYISGLICSIESFDIKEIAIFGKKILY